MGPRVPRSLAAWAPVVSWWAGPVPELGERGLRSPLMLLCPPNRREPRGGLPCSPTPAHPLTSDFLRADLALGQR